MHIDFSIEDLKKFSYTDIRIDNNVIKLPCALTNVVINPGGDKDGKAVCYPAQDTSANAFLTLYPVADYPRTVPFYPWLYLPRGIYVDITATIGNIIFQYLII